MKLLTHVCMLGVLVTAIGAMAPRPVAATAQEGAVLAVAAYTCPPGFTGTGQAFVECIANPEAGVVVQLVDTDDTTNSVTQTTGDDGGTAFDLSGFTPGEIAVFVEQLDGELPAAVNCNTNGAGAAPQPIQVLQRDPGPDAVRFVIAPRAGDQIGCSAYFIPAAQEPGPTATAPQGEGDGSLTVYATACPPGYAGDDYFADCYDNPQGGVEFSLGLFATDQDIRATTDAEGLATFSLAPVVPPADAPSAGSRIALAEVAPLASHDRAVFCTEIASDEGVALESGVGQISPIGEVYYVAFDIERGDQIRCDWYTIPAQIETPSPPTATATPVPGRPVAIYEGNCAEGEDDLGDVAVELADLVAPDGDPVGQEEAVAGEDSFTTVPLSLDDLLAADHAIAALAGDDDEVVACGEVGGVLTANGNLVFGLREVDRSGLTGIAYLSPNASDPTATDVFVFLADDLADDDEDDEATPTASVSRADR